MSYGTRRTAGTLNAGELVDGNVLEESKLQAVHFGVGVTSSGNRPVWLISPVIVASEKLPNQHRHNDGACLA